MWSISTPSSRGISTQTTFGRLCKDNGGHALANVAFGMFMSYDYTLRQEYHLSDIHLWSGRIVDVMTSHFDALYPVKRAERCVSPHQSMYCMSL